jgi:hypothetical protein
MFQNIYHVLCLHVTNILIHNLSMTKLPVSIFSATKRGVPNLDLFNINLFQVFYFITIMLFVSNIIPIDLSVIYFNNIKSVIYCIIIVVILVVNIPRFTFEKREIKKIVTTETYDDN